MRRITKAFNLFSLSSRCRRRSITSLVATRREAANIMKRLDTHILSNENLRRCRNLEFTVWVQTTNARERAASQAPKTNKKNRNWKLWQKESRADGMGTHIAHNINTLWQCTRTLTHAYMGARSEFYVFVRHTFHDSWFLDLLLAALLYQEMRNRIRDGV